MKAICIMITLILSFVISDFAQSNPTPLIPRESAISKKKFNLGCGLGVDYGGIGMNLLYYPDQRFGVFGGIGYAFAGLGYSIGAKTLLSRNEPKHSTHGFIDLMYGYNASVVVTNAPKFDKLFYGFSAGLGIDIHSKRVPDRFWSLTLILPFRDPEFNSYLDKLKSVYRVEFEMEPSPVLLSVGVHL